jgi:hypothetical protein
MSIRHEVDEICFHATRLIWTDPANGSTSTTSVVTTGVIKRRWLNCSGPTRRSSQQFDLRGFELPSDCVVKLITSAHCGSCKVIALQRATASGKTTHEGLF